MHNCTILIVLHMYKNVLYIMFIQTQICQGELLIIIVLSFGFKYFVVFFREIENDRV